MPNSLLIVTPSGARFNKDRTRRRRLWRTWDASSTRCCFICLNPSTADEKKNDHSVTKMIGFAKRMNCGALDVVNLFDIRTTYPKDLYGQDLRQLNSSFNDDEILEAASIAQVVICAWGGHGRLYERDLAVLEMLRNHRLAKKIKALKVNSDGTPAHPLRLAYSLRPATYVYLGELFNGKRNQA